MEKRKINCIIVGDLGKELIMDLEFFTKCNLTSDIEGSKFLGVYKNYPVVYSPQVERDKVFCIYKGDTQSRLGLNSLDFKGVLEDVDLLEAKASIGEAYWIETLNNILYKTENGWKEYDEREPYSWI